MISNSISPNTAIAVRVTVQVRRVSACVKPLMRLKIQKPLSFIHDDVDAPNPIASIT